MYLFVILMLCFARVIAQEDIVDGPGNPNFMMAMLCAGTILEYATRRKSMSSE
jgi:hypothetical protein